MEDYLRLSPLILPDFTGEMNRIESASLFHDETYKKHRDFSSSRVLSEFPGVPNELRETDDDKQTAKPDGDGFFFRITWEETPRTLRRDGNE